MHMHAYHAYCIHVMKTHTLIEDDEDSDDDDGDGDGDDDDEEDSDDGDVGEVVFAGGW